MLDLGSREPARMRSFVLEAAAAAGTLACIVVPRIGPLVVIGISIALSGLLIWQNIAREDLRQGARRSLLRPEIPFIAWVFVACIWAVEPGSALLKALFLAVLILHAVVLSQYAHQIEQRDIEALSRGLLAGFILGGLYLGVEITTRDGIARFVLTYLPELDRGIAKHGTAKDGVILKMTGAHITRVSVVLSLLACPAVLAATLYTKGLTRWLSYAAVVAVSLVIFFHPYSQSQTAQLAILVVVGSLLLAIASPTLARWVMMAGFSAWLALVVPASLAMFSAELHKSKELFNSARARVIIWNYTAEQVLENPILGVGTNSTRYIDEARTKPAETPKDLVVAPATRAHPHNIYLQIWYELGIVGVVAFGILGISLLLKTSVLPQPAAAFAIAHFAICMTVIAPTYGLWQNWFQSAIVLSVLALIAMTQRVRMAEPRPEIAARQSLPQPG